MSLLTFKKWGCRATVSGNKMKPSSFPSESCKIYLSIHFLKWRILDLAKQHMWHFLWCCLVSQLHQKNLTCTPLNICCIVNNTLALTCLEVHLFAVSSSGNVLGWNCADTWNREESQHMTCRRGRPFREFFSQIPQEGGSLCVCEGDISIVKWSSDWHSSPSAEAQLLRAAARPPVAHPDQMHTEWISREVWELN